VGLWRQSKVAVVACFVMAGAIAEGCALLSGASDLTIVNDSGAATNDVAASEASVLDVTSTANDADDADVSDARARVASGLLALYTFAETAGTTVHDVSGTPPALDLVLEDGGATFVPGGLSVPTASLVASAGPATKIISACGASEEVTIEAWVTPANDTQTQVRIGGVAGASGDLDVTLDEDGLAYSGYLRTDASSGNFSALFSPDGSVTLAPTQVVMTRSKAGLRSLYLDGVGVATDALDASFALWDTSHPFLLANATTLDLAWLGTYHLVAVYGRALTPAEVAQNFAAGP
jgi:hypothetical protein